MAILTIEDKLVAAYQAGSILARASNLDGASTDLAALVDAFEQGFSQHLEGLPLDPEPWAYRRESTTSEGPFGHPERAATRVDAAMMFYPRPGYEQDGDRYP